MDFEDRLRNQLHGQSNNIHVEVDSPVAVAHRSATRTRRRLVGIPVAALMLGGIVGGGIWASQNQSDPTESVAVVGDETSDENASDETASDENAGDQNEVDGPVDLERLITQGFSPGPELVLQDISSANSPGGWGPTQVHDTGGVYYVLSTAPGRVDLTDPDADAAYRPDTLYTYDGNDWSISGFGDRLVADFDVSPSGVLYAVSTGTTTDVTEFALGESANGGESWEWSPLPTGGHNAAKLDPRFVIKGDTTLIVSQLPFRQHFSEAGELARSAGLEVNEYDITAANTTGLTYMLQPVSDDPCVAAESGFWNEGSHDIPEGLLPPAVADDPADSAAFEAQFAAFQQEQNERLYAALSEAGCEQEATCRQITNSFYNDPASRFDMVPPAGGPDADPAAFDEFDQAATAFYEDRQNMLDQLLIDGGCQQEVTCRNLQTAFYVNEMPKPPFEPPPPPTDVDDMSAEEVDAMDAAWADFYERSQAWEEENRGLIDESYARHEASLVEAGCSSMAAPEAPEIKSVEWSSLGVTPPTDWASTMVQIIGPDGIQTSELEVDSYIYEITVDGDEFVLVEAGATPFPEPLAEPRNTEWRSADGLNWTKSDGDTVDLYNTATVNGQRFTIAWREGPNGAVLERSVVGDSATQEIDVTDLVPSLPSGLAPIQITGGQLGIVIVVSEQTYAAPPEEFYALFSPDGIGWSSQRLASTAQIPAVGADSVLLFEHRLDPSSDVPGAVYLGRVGG